MEIKTKFAIGAVVWTISKCKATKIEIEAITITPNGVWLRTKDCSAYSEDECFASKEELLKYVAGE